MNNINTQIKVREPTTGPHIESMGNVYRIIMTGEQTQGRFSVMEAFVNPGEGGPYHVHHREDESFLITEGEMAFYDGEKRTVATTGTFVMCPPGSKRAFRNESETLVKMIIFYTPPGIENMIEMEGKLIDPTTQVMKVNNIQKLACPQLSAEYGIDDFDAPLPPQVISY